MNCCIAFNKNKNKICNRKCINSYCGLHKNNIKINMKIIKENKNKLIKFKSKLNNLYKKKYVKIIDKYNYENLMNIYESFILRHL